MFDVFVASSLNAKIYNSINVSSFDELTDEALLELRNNIRNEYDTILVGANTVKNDNPTLLNKNKSNIRIVVDKYADLNIESKIFNNMPQKTYIILLKDNKKYENELIKKGVNVIKLKSKKDTDIIEKIMEIKKGNVLVEGGSKTIAYMANHKLINNIKMIMFPIFFSDNSIPLFNGLNEDINLELTNIENIENKYLYICYKIK